MKKTFKLKLIILLCLIIGIPVIIFLINTITYPITLKINPNDVATAKIIYYGEGVSEEITQPKDIRKLVRSLNRLRFKESEDMSHLSPHSGITIVELYNDKGTCVDCIQFYDWVYRGGEYKGSQRKDGIYLSVKNGLTLGNFYVLCDKLCGDPFELGIYKIHYYLQ